MIIMMVRVNERLFCDALIFSQIQRTAWHHHCPSSPVSDQNITDVSTYHSISHWHPNFSLLTHLVILCTSAAAFEVTGLMQHPVGFEKTLVHRRVHNQLNDSNVSRSCGSKLSPYHQPATAVFNSDCEECVLMCSVWFSTNGALCHELEHPEACKDGSSGVSVV